MAVANPAVSETATPAPQRARVPAWAVSFSILALAAAIFLLVFGNWNQWESGRSEQTTDDAFVRADVTALSTKASGLVTKMAVSDYQHVNAGELIASIRDDDYKAQQAGAEAALAGTEAGLPELSRQEEVAESNIARSNDSVSAAESQAVAAEAAIAAAESAVHAGEAGVSGAWAQYDNAKQESDRQEALFTDKATTLQKLEAQRAQTASALALWEARQSEVKVDQSQLDARKADLKRAQSSIAAAKSEVAATIGSRRVLSAKEGQIRAEIDARRAAVESSKISVGYTTIVAPTAGYIASRNVLPGQLVGPGTTVASLVDQAPWLQANFKETQLTHVRSGDEADIRIDTFPGKSWKGHVLFIAPESGSQAALLPPDNASGNFTKIVQRIPVKITFDPNQEIEPLRPGMSATVRVKTRKGV